MTSRPEIRTARSKLAHIEEQFAHDPNISEKQKAILFHLLQYNVSTQFSRKTTLQLPELPPLFHKYKELTTKNKWKEAVQLLETHLGEKPGLDFEAVLAEACMYDLMVLPSSTFPLLIFCFLFTICLLFNLKIIVKRTIIINLWTIFSAFLQIKRQWVCQSNKLVLYYILLELSFTQVSTKRLLMHFRQGYK